MAAEEQAELDAADAEEELDDSARAKNIGSNPEMVLKLLDNLRAENEELKDKALRAVAEMENMRRRTAKEVKDTRVYAVSNFARDMLNVSDNLARAIQAIPVEKRTEGSEEFKALIEGVEMTEREMLRALEANGVKKFNPEGEKFDPNIHQAMFEMPNPDLPNNSVGQVVAEGYMIADRVLRPAMVGVAKGGPKWEDVNPEPTEEELAAAEAEAGREEDNNEA
ncbi:nucleotide exchange factor GrpE [Pseudahrensia aquimaris]|uniref:Protein GrpE n=1 Tax=Pseudahrensia aquimaris TaxID=744461 RepID=A0ABW3FGR5_9HYPH